MEQKKKKNRVKNLIILLSVLLTLNLIALAATFIHNKLASSNVSTVMVPDNIITPDTDVNDSDYLTENTRINTSKKRIRGKEQDVEISLYKDHQEDNIAFQVGNMFPGDSETRYFKVKVSYKDQVTVHYHADIHSDEANLAGVMKMKIMMSQDGQVVYDGSIQDMPESLTYDMFSEEKTTTELDYKITAYLDPSVGNEYQNKNLAVDFRWWVEETNHLEPAAGTGDDLKPFLWMLVVSASTIICILLAIRHKRREEGKYG